MYTNQSAFTIVVTALLKQNKRSEEYYGKCLYRGPNGLKCAIGHLIPDNLYQPRMEKYCIITRMLNEFPLLRGYFNEVNLQLINNLQSIHDFFDPADWKIHFEKLSEKYHLEMPQ